MGWLIAIPALLVGVIIHNNILIVTSGLFAVAGAIGVLSSTIKQISDQQNKQK